jgi:hypothetical protein
MREMLFGRIVPRYAFIDDREAAWLVLTGQAATSATHRG